MNTIEMKCGINRSKSRKRAYQRLSLLCFLFALMTGPLMAQQGMVPNEQSGGAEELVRQIKEGMQKIDDNLLNAQTEGVGESLEENIRNIEKLLNDTRQQSNQVIQNLDELIKSIKYQQCGSGGGSDQPPPPQQQNNEKQDNKPRSEQEDQELQKHNDDSKSNEPQDDGKPEDGNPDDAPGSKSKSDTPPPDSGSENADLPDVSGRWGVLPPKLQNDILNFNIESFPEKYRKWLEEYYKRINRQKKNQ